VSNEFGALHVKPFIWFIIGELKSVEEKLEIVNTSCI
jgi:hypothetical protein